MFESMRRDEENVKGENPMYLEGGTHNGKSNASPLLANNNGGTGKKTKIAVVFAACLLMVGVLVFFLFFKKGDEGCGVGLEDVNGSCVDILECTETNECVIDDATGECPPDFNPSPCREVNTCTEVEKGGYICDCGGPYWRGQDCKADVNECKYADIKTACVDQPHHKCVNQVGQDLTCEYCGDGKTRSSSDVEVCVDIDECDTIGCPANHMCTNLEWTAENGGYTCDDCGEEFVSQDRGSCTPVAWDRCVEDPCGAHGSCTSVNFQYTCACHDGWGGKHCDEVDKCYTAPLTSKQYRWTADTLSSLEHGTGFGSATAALGKVNSDNIEDMAVGSKGANEGRGAVVLMLRTETPGALLQDVTVDATELAKHDVVLEPNDNFGAALATVKTEAGDVMLMVGAPGRGENTVVRRGAVFYLKLVMEGDSLTVGSAGQLSLPDLGTFSMAGSSVANIGLVNDDNYPDIAVGLSGDGGSGTVRLLFLSQDGTDILDWKKITPTSGTMVGFEGTVLKFGVSIASMGEKKRQWFGDAESTLAIAVGARYYTDGEDEEKGAVFVISLTGEYSGEEERKLEVKTARKIGPEHGGLETSVSDVYFGTSLACVGDVDKDGVPDLAVGSSFVGTDNTGAVHIVALSDVGVVKSSRVISETEGGFTQFLGKQAFFGSSLARVNPSNPDLVELIVGAKHLGAAVAYSVPFETSSTRTFLPTCELGDRCVADDSEFVGSSGQTCQAADWCAMSLCKHGSTGCALDTDPSDGDHLFTCSCADGWDGQTCEIDVDECATDSEACPDGNDYCYNLVGEHQCSACEQGTRQNPNDPTKCVDYLECTEGVEGEPDSSEACHNGGFCMQNGDKWFTCDCTDTSYTGDRCDEPYDECQSRDVCGRMHRCLDTGRVTCILCGNGKIASDDGTSCVAEFVNECAGGRSVCGESHKCVDTDSAYRCDSCGNGYKSNHDGSQCVDIDECVKWAETCGFNEKCVNKVGSHVCEWCGPGQHLGEDGRCTWNGVGFFSTPVESSANTAKGLAAAGVVFGIMVMGVVAYRAKRRRV